MVVPRLIAYLSLKLGRRLIASCARSLSVDLLSRTRIKSVPGLEKLGSGYGGWIVPTTLLDKNSVCYCAGVGEDITFDLGMIDRFGCEIFSFDPTPRAARHVAAHAASQERFHFRPVGLWSTDDTLRFYAPSDPGHVSHSILNLQQTTVYFEAPCRRISTLMREFNHRRIDLLKLDIEGAEYAVLDSIVHEGIDVGIICVEYDEAQLRIDPASLRRIGSSLRRLLGQGYVLVAADGVCNYTLLKRELFARATVTG